MEREGCSQTAAFSAMAMKSSTSSRHPPSPPDLPEVKDPWVREWKRACDENRPWLQLGFTAESGHYPWCSLCGKWAGEEHLNSKKCHQRREAHNISLSRHLQDLIEKDGFATGYSESRRRREVGGRSLSQSRCPHRHR
ncbi:unnamed protein product [Durusdinium trenchii]|uniref:Uncharacterized protein n=1 Tax=Durusdinium trenchii TaxID=1381693 RepID=A0ABP0QLC2_9DINO